jgi:hypothetical protein
MSFQNEISPIGCQEPQTKSQNRKIVATVNSKTKLLEITQIFLGYNQEDSFFISHESEGSYPFTSYILSQINYK